MGSGALEIKCTGLRFLVVFAVGRMIQVNLDDSVPVQESKRGPVFFVCMAPAVHPFACISKFVAL